MRRSGRVALPLLALAACANVYGSFPGRDVVGAPPAGAYFGAWGDTNCGTQCNTARASIAKLEGEVGRTFATHLFFGGLTSGQNQISTIATNLDILDDLAKGRTPIIAASCGGTTFAAIANGSDDAALDADATALLALPVDPNTGRTAKVIVRPVHEFNLNIQNPAGNPNGNNCFSTAAVAADAAAGNDVQEAGEYVAAFRHIENLWYADGVRNVTYEWCISANPNTLSNSVNGVPLDVRPFYPGDQYVDWVGFDAYDKNQSNEKSVSNIFSPAFAIYSKLWASKLLALEETGEINSNGPYGGQSYTGWTTQPTYYGQITTAVSSGGAFYPSVKMVVYFNNCPGVCPTGAYNWTIDDPADGNGGAAAFATMVNGSFFSPMIP